MKPLTLLTFLTSICLVTALLPVTLNLTGCATTQTSSTSKTQTLINDAWTVANKLQTYNNGQIITPGAQDTILKLTHNSGDAEYASMASALINQVLGAVVSAQAAKVNAIPAVNVVLAPDHVEAVAETISNQ